MKLNLLLRNCSINRNGISGTKGRRRFNLLFAKNLNKNKVQNIFFNSKYRIVLELEQLEIKDLEFGDDF